MPDDTGMADATCNSDAATGAAGASSYEDLKVYEQISNYSYKKIPHF